MGRVTLYIFYPILLLQVLLIISSIIKKEKELIYFSIWSFTITAFIAGVIEFKIHHYLRLNYGIPNTLVYITGLLLFLLFVYYGRKILMQNYYYLLVFTFFAWGIAAAADLLSDPGYLPFSTDLIEDIFTAAGGISMLLFYIFINHRYLLGYNKENLQVL
jgi:hypothetical protein